MQLLDRLTRRGPDGADDVEAQMLAAQARADAGDYAGALAIWNPLAQAGVAKAQNNIGVCFANGLGVEADPTLAFRWLHAAAAGGSAAGQRNLATCYAEGRGVEQDFAEAASWYRRAAEQGDAEAQNALSRLLFDAEYLPPDYAEARRWAEAAAAQGVAAAETRLGMIYHNALGVTRATERSRPIGGSVLPAGASPMRRRCSARRTISAPRSRAIRSWPWLG